jgi:hypothetical protein
MAEEKQRFDALQVRLIFAETERLLLSQAGAFYKTIPSAAVDASKERLARWAAELVSADLGIELPRISWFTETDPMTWLAGKDAGGAPVFRVDHSILGRARAADWVIELNVANNRENVVLTVAHEMRHLSQSTITATAGWTVEEREQDAKDYAGTWASKGRVLAVAAAGLAGQFT